MQGVEAGSTTRNGMMVWNVAKKEFLLNVVTLKFVTGSLLCLALSACIMPVLVESYKQDFNEYTINKTANERELKKAKVYQNIVPRVYRKPSVLSVFASVEEGSTCSTYQIDSQWETEADLHQLSTQGMDFLRALFPVVDITFVFEIIISALALMLAHDLVSGERECGTLKLSLSNSISRSELILGKVIAGGGLLFLPVAAIYLTALTALWISGVFHIGRHEWICVLMMSGLTWLYVSMVFNVGLFISCLCRKEASSLVAGLFCWVFMVFMVPNLGAHWASYWGDRVSSEEQSLQVDDLKVRREQEIKGVAMGGMQMLAQGAYGKQYLMLCDSQWLISGCKGYPVTEPIKNRYFNMKLDVELYYLKKQVKQMHLASLLHTCSPTRVYRNMMSLLAGSDPEGALRFLQSVRAYANEVFDFLKQSTDHYRNPAYFTPCREGDFALFIGLPRHATRQEVVDTVKAIRKKGVEHFKQKYDRFIQNVPSLELKGFPRFGSEGLSVADKVRGILPTVLITIALNIVVLVLTFVKFMRYDVR